MVVELTKEQLVAKLVNVSKAAHRGAFKGVQKGCFIGQRTAMKYCTPGSSPFDPMVFPTKKTRKKNGETTGAPLDMGILKAHIYIKVEDKEDEISGGVGCGDAGNEGPATIKGYPLYVHEGTGGRHVSVYAGGKIYEGKSGEGLQARPFIRRAIEDEHDEIQDAIKDETWGSITEAALL